MPDWNQAVRRRLADLRLTGHAEDSLASEIAGHLEDRYRELLAGGETPGDAQRLAIAELDNLTPLRASLGTHQIQPASDPEPIARGSSAAFLSGLWKDLRFTLRSLRKNPVFVLFVVLTLALGIGANTTVFTLVNTLILSPLPVPDAGRLAAVAGSGPRNSAPSTASFSLSFPDIQDYRTATRAFSSLAAYTSTRGMTLQQHGSTQGVFGELVTDNYFATLGLTPARGRFFQPQDATAPVAILNYASWQKLFGADESILGRELHVNNLVVTVIGVAPPHFLGVNAIFGPDLWFPAGLADRLFPTTLQHALTDRAQPAFLAVGRLRPGATEAGARAEIETLAAGLSRAYPDTNQDHAATVRPLRDVLLAVNGTTAGGMIFASAALLAVVAIVLLIACSNVANLLLARSAARRQEMAVRLAMGASRYRLVRQLLTESMFLGLLSGAVGLSFAWAGLQSLFAQLPGAANFPAPKLDASVFAFALFVSLLTGFVFGIFPALRASRGNLAEDLKESARTAGRSHRRVTLAAVMLTGQVALSFVLLVTAALFLRSMGRAYQLDPGFQTAHLAVFPANPGQAGYDQGQSRLFYQQVRDRVAALPGVASLSWASNMPLWARPVPGLQIEGRAARSRADVIRTVVNTVDRDYFAAAGVTLVDGRAFTDADRDSSLPVAMINQKLAGDYFPAGALGRRLQVPGEKTMRTIVGIVRTANYSSWGEAPQNCVYLPLAQNPSDSMVLYVRTYGDPRQILAPAEREIRATAPLVLLFGVRSGREIIEGGLFQARMGVGLLTIFGLLALGLASIGLYGVLAYSVNQRRREIGLRMALGATRFGVLRMILRQGMTLVAAGLIIGLLAAIAAGRLVSGLLFGVSPADPVSLASAGLALAGIALLACYLPARNATRIDPIKTLRDA